MKDSYKGRNLCWATLTRTIPNFNQNSHHALQMSGIYRVYPMHALGLKLGLCAGQAITSASTSKLFELHKAEHYHALAKNVGHNKLLEHVQNIAFSI